MRLKFKVQAYQTHAVEAVVNCFAGQPKQSPTTYRIDPGRGQTASGQKLADLDQEGFRNAEFAIPNQRLLENVQAVQHAQNLPRSAHLVSSKACDVNLDVEMETGTGKTYCYIKSMFALNAKYGWSKFIVVVPSIAIREGVRKAFDITADHFLDAYGKRARCFIYDSKRLHEIENFSSDAGINVMIINVQAFNARGKDARRIYEELDDFQSRRPIDVLKKNNPILILDEPQKMEGAKTLDGLAEFNPLFILRYSATHKTQHNRVYRLDALDAYNQRLVKKIAVRGITVRGVGGTHGYLYLESILTYPGKAPEARIEFEVKRESGIKRITRKFGGGDNLHVESGELEQYKGYVIADIDARDNTVKFTNGVVLTAGEATGDVSEGNLRRIQIREAVRAHFEKEQRLFDQGLKVLSLFFIDEVAKYRSYQGDAELPGEYATIFEEEYNARLNETLTLEDTPYNRYLKGIATAKTHNGYFSIDKKTKRLINPETGKSDEADDVDAYDLILKDKERLLSFAEPTRFIFSHSALREGWDNPNVFVICALKHSDNTTSRRQEVGRGLRLAVNQSGDRMDYAATVHQINVLTVVASESYKDFVKGLQTDISKSLSARPRTADEAYFTGKVLKTPAGDIEVTKEMARALHRYLIKHDFADDKDQITQAYHDAKATGTLPALPPELAPNAEQVLALVATVFTEGQIPLPEDDRKAKTNDLNANFNKAEFQALWNKINRKAVYTVHFDSAELIKKAVAALDKDLKVARLHYTIQRGEQKAAGDFDDLQQGESFTLEEHETKPLDVSVQSTVKYDLIGKLAADTKLTRRTIAQILTGINLAVFNQYKVNPEDFMLQAARIINEQKATVIVEHLAYNPLEESHTAEIFTREKPRDDFSKAYEAKRHVYDYVFTDSKNERAFVEELDTSTEVVVYAKLPRSFLIPTPVGDYNPDWAIAFQEGAVKHVYFIAETKGSMSSMELRKIEESKIECARKFFAKITSTQVKYDVVDSYAKLMELVK